MSKVNYMAKQTAQDSDLMSYQVQIAPHHPTTTWRLQLLPPPLQHDSALLGPKSACKIAGAWQKTYPLSRVLYMYLIFKLLACLKLGCTKPLQILKSYLRVTQCLERTEAHVVGALCWQSATIYLVNKFQVPETLKW